ncbi:O-antigen ligase [Pandoraea sp. SD6-2]|uniref:O-antigen ligase family protein n=1 Tax=Pandoraea sp. SD6-2 TaxID=1286093 RepID=UPI00032E1F5F|nr:O-antigen ligase [Pandoraea sp. SD6-2]EON11219.1 lipopolysaccharide o-antigen ligase protein [Pandoraea sp. SD6-2]
MAEVTLARGDKFWFPMPNTKNSISSHLAKWLPGLLITVFPAAALSIPHAANALLIVVALISLRLCFHRNYRSGVALSLRNVDVRIFCVAMAAPIASIFVSEALHGNFVASTFDSASRFLIAIPIFLVLRARRFVILSWSGLCFSLGGVAVAAVVVFAPRDWGYGRIGSAFLNPIHFGDIATVLMVLSLVSIHWLARDSCAVLALKVIGAVGAGYASLAGGSRGGWIALPAIALLVVYVGMRGRTWRSKLAALAVIAVVLALPFRFAPTVMSRFGEARTDIGAMRYGDDDTNVGVRLKLYQVGAMLFLERPWTGLGANGFKRVMAKLEEDGVLSPHAAQLGRGETHNQIIAYAVDYGIPGLFAALALYAMPWWMFWRGRRSAELIPRRTSLMGLIFVLSFFVFGLTVDTFTLKVTASVYAGILAVLAGLAVGCVGAGGVAKPCSGEDVFDRHS